MASRKEEKARARQRRLEAERISAASSRRRRRLQVLGGIAAAAMVIVVVLVVVSVGGGAGSGASGGDSAAVRHVDTLLAGIQESGATLGSPRAPVTVTEYGDLECSVCDVFAAPTTFTNPEGERGSGFEDDLIAQDVRAGRVKLVFRSLETASEDNPDQQAFALQQSAANAAGLQGKEWYYIELFYNEQGAEGANYVTSGFLDQIARHIHGLDYAKWSSDRSLASVENEVVSDNARGTGITEKLSQGVSTPTLLVQGPKGEAPAMQGLTAGSWSQLQAEIRSVA